MFRSCGVSLEQRLRLIDRAFQTRFASFLADEGDFSTREKGTGFVNRVERTRKQCARLRSVSQLVSMFDFVFRYVIPCLLLFYRNIVLCASSTVLMLTRTDSAVRLTRERENYV